MSDVAVESAAARAAPDVVPAEIALSAPRRVRPRWWMMLLGVPGLWVLPKTFGAHLAAGPLWLAALACAFGSAGELGAIIVYQAVDLPEDIAHPDLPLFDKCRIVVAEFALDAAGSGNLRPLLFVGMVAFGGVVVATLLWIALPAWIAAGDSSRAAFGRSLRLGLWLTTLSIPIAAFSIFVTPRLRRPGGIDTDDAVGITIVLACLYFLWTALRSGLRYAGPAEGPGFASAEPHCAECGYALQGLPNPGRCPECGEPITQSLARYTEPPAAPPMLRRWLRRFAMVPRTILTPKRTLRTLRVQFDAPEARAFWAMNVVTISLGFLAYVFAFIVRDLPDGGRFDWESLTVAVLLILLIGAGSQAIMAVICTLGTLLRRGKRRMDLRITTIALGYASALLWPAALWMLTFLITFDVADGKPFFVRRFTLPVLHRVTAVSEVIWLGSTIGLVALLGLWALWIDKGYRNLRHTRG